MLRAPSTSTAPSTSPPTAPTLLAALLVALLVALTLAAGTAAAQSYDQQAEAERVARQLVQIDKANAERARAAQPLPAGVVAAGQGRSLGEGKELWVLAACAVVAGVLVWGLVVGSTAKKPEK